MMEEKLKYLEFIQGIIDRLASNSFFAKGWTITIVSAILGLAIDRELKDEVFYISFLPIMSFWVLDGYYLWQERLFRNTYDNVLRSRGSDFDLSNFRAMKSKGDTLSKSIFSMTLLVFYMSLMVLITLIIIIL